MKQCKNQVWTKNFPISVLGATGTFINNTILVCGGKKDAEQNTTSTCEVQSSHRHTWTVNKMNKRRHGAAVSLVANQTWITGGCVMGTTDMSYLQVLKFSKFQSIN